MRKFLMLVVLTILVSSNTAFASENAPARLQSRRTILAKFIVAAESRSSPRTMESAAVDPCYAWDASNTCFGGDEPDTYVGQGGGGTEKCDPAVNLSTCLAKCDCEKRNHLIKCKYTLQCRQSAETNERLCQGMCITDYDA